MALFQSGLYCSFESPQIWLIGADTPRPTLELPENRLGWGAEFDRHKNYRKAKFLIFTSPGGFLCRRGNPGNRSEGPLVEAYSNLEPVRLNLLTVEGSMLEGMPLAGAVNED